MIISLLFPPKTPQKYKKERLFEEAFNYILSGKNTRIARLYRAKGVNAVISHGLIELKTRGTRCRIEFDSNINFEDVVL